MKRAVVILAVLWGSLAPAWGAPWQINKENSTLGFSIDVQERPLLGSFAKFEPRIEFDADDPAAAILEVEVDLTSVSIGNAQGDGIVKSSSWLGASDNATAVFRAEGFTKTGEGAFTADGELTLKTSTLPIRLEFTLQVTGNQAKAKGTAALSRKTFQIGAEKSAAVPVDDAVTVMFELEAVKGE